VVSASSTAANKAANAQMRFCPAEPVRHVFRGTGTHEVQPSVSTHEVRGDNPGTEGD
jgi:hypothetical protein